MSDRRRAWEMAIVGACLVIELIVLAWPEPKTQADGRFGRGMSGEIAGATKLAQRFTAAARGLHSITFYPHAVGETVSGDVELELAELRRNQPYLIDRQRVPAAKVVSGGAFTYRFRWLSDSRGATYLLTIALPETPPGHGIAVELMKHDYPGNPPNTLYYAGLDRYGSLRFTTETERPSMLVRTWRYLAKAPFGVASVPIAVAFWIGLHVLGLRAIGAARPALLR